VEPVAAVFDLRKVRTAQLDRFERANNGEMRRFEEEIDADRFLRLSREPAGDCIRASSSVASGRPARDGPHLDYRLKKNGAFINPLTAHRAMPPADPVPAARMVKFNDVRDRAFAAFSVPAVTRAAR
jgi:hypothetical protein